MFCLETRITLEQNLCKLSKCSDIRVRKEGFFFIMFDVIWEKQCLPSSLDCGEEETEDFSRVIFIAVCWSENEKLKKLKAWYFTANTTKIIVLTFGTEILLYILVFCFVFPWVSTFIQWDFVLPWEFLLSVHFECLYTISWLVICQTCLTSTWSVCLVWQLAKRRVKCLRLLNVYNQMFGGFSILGVDFCSLHMSFLY